MIGQKYHVTCDFPGCSAEDEAIGVRITDSGPLPILREGWAWAMAKAHTAILHACPEHAEALRQFNVAQREHTYAQLRALDTWLKANPAPTLPPWKENDDG